MMENIKDCFPWGKLPDLIIFVLLFALIGLVAILNHWDLVNTLSSALMGAATTYIKGQG